MPLHSLIAAFGPRSTPFEPRPAPFIALAGLGFLLAVIGHVFGWRTLVGTGIAMVFCAILVLPIVLYLTHR